ncbi:hypothetical protein BN946_scf184901.g6 [Trametes cinnabarina]|uniref:Protein-S-isoprenylcysteine O-methyltransferase n=1 Tax=Pycnoporus cinnabarinus TaxID=5643 RepID=A0A060SXC7_PYCCI|nr:hypothetical protein BN946_scf184901.g6 [Trametes cinnabarina]
MNWLVSVKLPALVAAMICEYIALTAPNPPPGKSEQAKGNRWEATSTVVKQAIFAISFVWSIYICEIAVILAKEAGGPLASSILTTLLRRPHAIENINVNPIFLFGIALMVFGGVLRKSCYMILGRYFTYQLAILKEHNLVTWGPYAVVRHPSYTAFFCVTTGNLITQFAPGGWLRESGVLDMTWAKLVMAAWVLDVLSVMTVVFRRIPVEDEMMRKEFGEQWDQWSKRTPYKLVPYVY